MSHWESVLLRHRGAEVRGRVLPAGQRAQALLTTKRLTAQTVGTQACSSTSQIIRHGQVVNNHGRVIHVVNDRSG